MFTAEGFRQTKTVLTAYEETAESPRTPYYKQQGETWGFIIRSAFHSDSWFHWGTFQHGITYNNHLGSYPRLVQGLTHSIPLLVWEKGLQRDGEITLHTLNDTATLTETTLVAVLTASPAQRSKSVGVLVAHCFALFLPHKVKKHQTLPHRKKKPKQKNPNCALSKVTASSARIESVYYSFLMARCEKEYKHIWQWNLRAAGTSLPQGSLPLLLYFGFLYMTQRYLWKQMTVSFYQL